MTDIDAPFYDTHLRDHPTTLTGSVTPGVNVDPIDVSAGLQMAATIGYSDWQAQMVAEHALLRWKRGEETSGQRLWLSEYPNDLTSWTMILAAAQAGATNPSDWDEQREDEANRRLDQDTAGAPL
jgi:hypothetical protein